MPTARHALTDSPWLWVCLFAVAGLIGLAAISSKYDKRQAQIEREFQGRQRAAQNVQGQSPDVPLSTPDKTMIPLWPLIVGLAAIIPIAWVIVWRRQLSIAAHSGP